MQELEEQHGFVFDPATISRTTAEYATHIENLQKAEDLDALTAHMYVRHFGDMYGGAMISKKVPGAGLMYEFEDKENLKASLRELLIDDMAPEANICFEYAIRLFEELV
jgi:heme oxygenase